MSRAKRISMSLFNDEVRALINASAKIFPVTQHEIDNNLNSNGYEYARVGNHIYRWDGVEWSYIVADDVNISFSELKEIPIDFKPSAHKHVENDIIDLDKYTQAEVDNLLYNKANITDLHEHANKVLLDRLTEKMISEWNNAYVHISDSLRHVTSIEKELWNTVQQKANTIELTSGLAMKADIGHNHDGAYPKKSDLTNALLTKSNKVHVHTEEDITNLDKYTKEEVINLLDTKSDTEHTHSALHTHDNKAVLDKLIETDTQVNYDISNLKYIEDIKNGYTEGHTHSNLTTLNLITQEKYMSWEDAVTMLPSKADKTYVDGKVLTDVPADAKFTDTIYTHPSTHPVSMITGLQGELEKAKPTIGVEKPVDGSMWYEVI